MVVKVESFQCVVTRENRKGLLQEILNSIGVLIVFINYSKYFHFPFVHELGSLLSVLSLEASRIKRKLLFCVSVISISS